MGLLSLPDELLDLIVDSADWSCPNVHPFGSSPCRDCPVSSLRSLRLVCQRLSRLYSVNTNLFQSIQLIADSAHYITKEQILASGIAPCVQHVTLVQPLYASMDFEDFVEIYVSAHPMSRGSERYQSSDENSRMDNNGQAAQSSRVDDMVGHTTMTSLEDAYARYDAIAEDSLAELQSTRSLERAWTPLLKLFIHCKSFSIPLVDYRHIGADYVPIKPRRSPWFAFAWSTRPDLGYDLAANSFELAALFVPQAVAALAATGCRVEVLELSHAYDPGSFEGGAWSLECDWNDVDLSALNSLTINTYLDNTIYLEPVRRGLIVRALQEDVQQLLVSCSSTLQYRFQNVLNDRGGAPIEMSQLTTVELLYLETSALWFTSWLTAMPQLLSLLITDRGMKLVNEPVENWKEVFTALRDHPTLAEGSMQIFLSDAWTLKFDHNDFLEGRSKKDWMDDTARSSNEERYTRFGKASRDPAEVRRLLDEEIDSYGGDDDDHSRKRLAKFFIHSFIEWPGIEKLEKKRGMVGH